MDKLIEPVAYTLMLALGMAGVFAVAAAFSGNPSHVIAWHIMAGLAQVLGAALGVLVLRGRN